MSISRLHSLYAISIFPSALTSELVLDGVLRQSVESGLEVRKQTTSGNVYPRFVSIVNGRPVVRFATRKLVQALDNIGPTGLKITEAVGTKPGVKLFAYAHEDGGSRQSGSNHRQYLIRKGLMYPRTLSVSEQADCELDYELTITHDGTNAPIVESDAVAVPTLSGDDEVFGIGPITLENISIPQVRRVEIDFGIECRAQVADGEVFPSWCSIISIMPRITLRGIDVEWLKSSNVPRDGLPITHANTSIFFRKRDQDGQYVADATAEHINVTAAGLTTVQTLFDADGDGEGECSLQIDTRHDGTNTPLVINTTSAIA